MRHYGAGMTDPGWRSINGSATAWFDAPSQVQAAVLAGRVVELAPDSAVDVRAGGARVRLDSAEHAAAVSAAARDLGLTVDPGALQRLDVVLESADPAGAARFWGSVLGPDPADRDPALLIRRSNEHRPLRNRIHLDVVRPAPAVAELGLGAGAGPYGVRQADPEGNEVDLLPGGPLGEGADDWWAVFSAMACYRTDSPAQLAAAAADLVAGTGLPLLVDVRPGLVVLDSGKDQWEDGVCGSAADVLALATRLQSAARDLGAVADPQLPRFVQLFLDAADVAAVQAFWTAVLGYVADERPGLTEIHDPRRLGPVMVSQPLDPAEEDRRRQRNRLHLVLTVPEDAVRTRIDTALAAGGRLLDDGRVADPEGNELVVTSG